MPVTYFVFYSQRAADHIHDNVKVCLGLKAILVKIYGGKKQQNQLEPWTV